MSFLQENIFCPESKLLGLSGGDSQAEVYRIEPSSASQDLEFFPPAWRDLKNATSVDQVDALTVPEQNPSAYRGKSSLNVPPLVLNAILEAPSLVPAALIPILSTKFQEFDRSSNHAKACTTLRSVLEFL